MERKVPTSKLQDRWKDGGRCGRGRFAFRDERWPSNTLQYVGIIFKAELCIGFVLALAAGSVWKMYYWNEQRKVRTQDLF